MDAHIQPLTWKRLFIGIAVVFGVMFICIGGFALSLDAQCAAELAIRLPPYPGAVFVSETHSFLRANGMGSTIAIWESDDEPFTIDQFYGKQLANAVQRANSGIARSQWEAFLQEDGTGSVIILYGNCVT